MIFVYFLYTSILYYEYQKKRPGDIAQVYANTKKFKKILMFRPKHNNIKLIIQSAIKWEKNLKDY